MNEPDPKLNRKFRLTAVFTLSSLFFFLLPNFFFVVVFVHHSSTLSFLPQFLNIFSSLLYFILEVKKAYIFQLFSPTILFSNNSTFFHLSRLFSFFFLFFALCWCYSAVNKEKQNRKEKKRKNFCMFEKQIFLFAVICSCK